MRNLLRSLPFAFTNRVRVRVVRNRGNNMVKTTRMGSDVNVLYGERPGHCETPFSPFWRKKKQFLGSGPPDLRGAAIHTFLGRSHIPQ